MKEKLWTRLLPLMVKISKDFTTERHSLTDKSRFPQIIDFVVKAVEERIDRMSQTEGDKS